MATDFPRLRSPSAAFQVTLATALAVLSFFWHTLLARKSLYAEALLGYVPLMLGTVCMWLCFKARVRAKHKSLVLWYSLALAPFAFSYPAWMLIVWIAFASARYNGPMP